MNTKQLINSALTVAGLALMAAGAQAQTVEQFASATGGNNTFIYTSGVGLTMTSSGFYSSLDVPSAGTVLVNPTKVVFTGLANNGALVQSIVNGNAFFDQKLTGGLFTLTDGASNILLQGSFSGADLTGFLGTNAAGVDTNFTNVQYTGGSYASTAGILLGPQSADKFNFSLLSAQPSLGVTMNSLNSFKAAGNGQFTGVAPAPEPATLVPFALGGLGLLGLIVRKTRRTNGAAA